MVKYGKETTVNKRRPVNPGRPSGDVVGDHLLIQTETRKRCTIYPARRIKKILARTRNFLCKNCFASWHLP